MATKKTQKKTKKIKILKPPAGVFCISDNVGDVVEKETKQADEMIKAGYAKQVK